MKLIDSNNQEEVNVAVQLDGREVADLLRLSETIGNYPGGDFEETVRETTSNLYYTLVEITKRHELPAARSINNLYIQNNIGVYDRQRQRVVAREQEQRAQAVPVPGGMEAAELVFGRAVARVVDVEARAPEPRRAAPRQPRAAQPVQAPPAAILPPIDDGDIDF